jgi:fructosamine-3-kinase
VASIPAERAAALLGGELVHTVELAGGDLSQILRIRLADGREAVVKGGPGPEIEAAMLEAIAASGAPAPAVLAVDSDVLVLELLPQNGSVADAWEHLGHVLATLHAVRGAGYGWPSDYAFGSLPIQNAHTDHWPTFWAERRLLMHVDEIDARLGRRIETLAVAIGNRLPARPQAALLHGDLWSGNVLVADGRVSGLVDPACYYGHTEVDIAMLGLFARPGGAFLASYGPRESGHAERLPIYRLWPALVHLRLFGRGYASLVERLLDAAGA